MILRRGRSLLQLHLAWLRSFRPLHVPNILIPMLLLQFLVIPWWTPLRHRFLLIRVLRLLVYPDGPHSHLLSRRVRPCPKAGQNKSMTPSKTATISVTDCQLARPEPVPLVSAMIIQNAWCILFHGENLLIMSILTLSETVLTVGPPRVLFGHAYCRSELRFVRSWCGSINCSWRLSSAIAPPWRPWGWLDLLLRRLYELTVCAYNGVAVVWIQTLLYAQAHLMGHFQ